MRPDVRETIFARTRAIIRANLPLLEGWIAAQGELLTYVRPVAGAIAYMKYELPIRSTPLVDKIRDEQSVLLVPGDMFGLGKGIRVGFGFDVEQTLKGLERVATVLADVAANGAELVPLPRLVAEALGEVAPDVEAQVLHRRVVAERNARDVIPSWTRLADRPVLAVHEVPEVDRVRGSNVGFAISSGWNRKSHDDRACDRRPSAQSVNAATWSADRLTMRFG